MKLGFWNRLAIVASGIACVTGATYFVLDQNSKMATSHQIGYDACIKSVTSTPGWNSEGFKTCNDIWLNEARSPTPWLGWNDWWQAMGVIALACGILYLFLWAFAEIGKWVWRGWAA